MKPKVVILDSNVELAKIYAEILEDHCDTLLVHSIASANELIDQGAVYDLLVTELELSDGQWNSPINAALRSRINPTPVLIVTRVDDSEVMQMVLEDGASDFLTKPVNNNEFLAKCRHLTSARSLYQCDAIGMTVARKGALSDELTSNEFRLMTLLARQSDHTVTVEEAARSIWGQKVSDQRIHTMLSRLRPKIRGLHIQLEMTKDDAIVLRDLLKEV